MESSRVTRGGGDTSDYTTRGGGAFQAADTNAAAASSGLTFQEKLQLMAQTYMHVQP